MKTSHYFYVTMLASTLIPMSVKAMIEEAPDYRGPAPIAMVDKGTKYSVEKLVTLPMEGLERLAVDLMEDTAVWRQSGGLSCCCCCPCDTIFKSHRDTLKKDYSELFVIITNTEDSAREDLIYNKKVSIARLMCKIDETRTQMIRMNKMERFAY